MGNQKMPEDRLEGFGMRSDVLRIYSRHDAAGVRHLGGISAIPSHDSKNRRADLLCVLQRRDQVRADVFLEVPPPTENIITASFDWSRLPFNHSTKTDAHPSSLVLAVNSDTLSVGA